MIMTDADVCYPYPGNDCYGFTSDKATNYSNCLKNIIGGPVLPTVCPCNTLMSLVCCTD